MELLTALEIHKGCDTEGGRVRRLFKGETRSQSHLLNSLARSYSATHGWQSCSCASKAFAASCNGMSWFGRVRRANTESVRDPIPGDPPSGRRSRAEVPASLLLLTVLVTGLVNISHIVRNSYYAKLNLCYCSHLSTRLPSCNVIYNDTWPVFRHRVLSSYVLSPQLRYGTPHSCVCAQDVKELASSPGRVAAYLSDALQCFAWSGHASCPSIS